MALVVEDLPSTYLTYGLCITLGYFPARTAIPLLIEEDLTLCPSLRCFYFRTFIIWFPNYCGVRLYALPAIKCVLYAHFCTQRQ